MRTCIAFVAACLVLSTAKADLDVSSEQKTKVGQDGEDCKSQSGVDVKVLMKIREGVFPEDPKFKDYVFCVCKRAGYLNEAGEVQNSVIIEKLGAALQDAERARKLTEQCAKQEGSATEVVYKVFSCLFNSTKHDISIFR